MLEMGYTLHLTSLICFVMLVLSSFYDSLSSVIVAFFSSTFYSHFKLLLLMFFLSIVFSNGKLSFSQYLLTQDRVKLLKGKNVVAEESVFQLVANVGGNNSEAFSYQLFLPFDEELDEKLELAYELRIHGEKISNYFYIFTRIPISEEKLDEKIQSILGSFNLKADYINQRYDALEDAFLSIIGGEYFTHVCKVRGEKNVLLLELGDSPIYIAVIVLRGAPDYESLDPKCMDIFVNSVKKLGGDVSFVVPFRFVKTSESDYMLKKDLKVRIKVNGKFPVKYLETSPYLVVRGSSIESVMSHAKRVCIAASAAWSGPKKRINLDFLDSNILMRFLHNIMCRQLLPEREILNIQDLSVYLRIPNQRTEVTAKCLKSTSSGEIKDINYKNNRVLLGKTILNGRSVPVWMYHNDFLKHLFIFGDSNRKTRF
ncbi:MAG: hypothetical protein QXS27_05460, partial [Candidatus Jordarchaeaceae archaeon]